MTKKFYIGIGSQRAGSTLLHRILDRCTNIYMHPVKELHYFDTIYGVRNEEVLRKYSQDQLNRELTKFCDVESSFNLTKREKNYLNTNRLLAFQDLRSFKYIDLYRPCLMHNDMLGEITPEYMILPEPGVKELSEVVGEDAYIFLLTREPVDRFISSYKLLVNYGDRNSVSSSKSIIDVVKDMPDWAQQQKKLSDYANAYRAFKKYFNNIVVLDYESLVDPTGVGIYKILDSAELKYDKHKVKAMLSTKVNDLGSSYNFDKASMDFLEEYFSEEVVSYHSFLNKINTI